jgi:hypothetical protein
MMTQPSKKPMDDVYSSRNNCTLFESEIKKTPDHLLTQLLSHIAKREGKQAEEILKIHPELLFEPGNTQDALGNAYINYTPIELARYFHDVDMLKMMKTYLSQISDGEEQFIKALTEAHEECENHKAYNFKKLIDSHTFDDEENFRIESNRFKQYCKPKEIKNRKSFNMQDLFAAYAIYISVGKTTSKYTTWDKTWDSEQRLFLLHEVINPLWNLLPACYAKHKGLDNLNELYQTKMKELLQLTLNTDKEHNKCSACALM